MVNTQSPLFSRFSQYLTQTLTLTLDLGHWVRPKWDEGPNLTPTRFFYRNFTAMRFLRYNSAGLHFQESRVVQKRMGYGLFLIFRHKQASNEQKKHIFQYLNGGTFRLRGNLESVPLLYISMKYIVIISLFLF